MNNHEPSQPTPREKRLYRSQRERMIGGVCGGLAEYFKVDPTLVRIALVVLAFAGGWGIIAYIIGLIIMPENPGETKGGDVGEKTEGKSAGFVWGLIFILVGFVLLLFNYDLFPWQLWRFWYFPWKLLWPVALIVIGVMLLLSRSKEKNNEHEIKSGPTTQTDRKLTRSKRERMIGGVCGGLSDYFRFDPTLVRLIWAVGTIVSHGLGIVAYIILLIVLPEENIQTETKA